jgi:DNA helicase IV
MADPVSETTLFPELEIERAHQRTAEACRHAMVAALEALDPEQGAADRITTEYIEMTVADALADLREPGAARFFGRLDTDESETWYVGRRHIHDHERHPVVVDWRAPVAEPFYRATSEDRCGVRRRRRFTLDDGAITAYLDERLDDPDALPVAGGVPDPLLAEIGAARTGAMRDIVATIQAEQDRVIRLPRERCLAVQGGPGTGKTAVGLHRVAYLLFRDRRVLARDGVLVVGPNRVFLEYISNVLPSLGERSVRQATLAEVLSPRVPVTAGDDAERAMVKGSARMAAVVERAVVQRLPEVAGDVRAPLGARTVVVSADDLAHWRATALAGTAPVNVRRAGFRALVEQQLLQRHGIEQGLRRLPALRAAVDRLWPVLRPVPVVERLLANRAAFADAASGVLSAAEIELAGPRGRRGAPAWTEADQLLVDEAAGLLDGTPRTYGLVVVDEAQDLSAMALRAVSRRSPAGAVTLLGDLAQATTPAAQASWHEAFAHLGTPGDVVELTVSYRLPDAVARVANGLLPRTAAPVTPSRAVRPAAHPVRTRLVGDPRELAAAAAEEVQVLRGRHRLSGVVVPRPMLHDVADALAGLGLRAVGHVQSLDVDEVAVLAYETVKGLELDGVVVCAPEVVDDGTPTGARLVYIAVSRAVQSLTVVTARRDVLGRAAGERMGAP